MANSRCVLLRIYDVLFIIRYRCARSRLYFDYKISYAICFQKNGWNILPGQARYSFCAPIISNKIDNKFEKKREGVDPPEEKNIFSSGKRF